ncbi:hypothetical protein BN946_scf184994.g18 [Trametes cinnabarina]|uniref:Letm1 RBD domain-containing protein n=1 Tax=Pycnoporus cinnabarinus TaxID=5643 RepID=A0A060SEI0_PYCCI|nr:hypothetical protein BN946_scf184994.g18 [Trametes cinnabarina]
MVWWTGLWRTTALYSGTRFLSSNPPPPTIESSSKEVPPVVPGSSTRKPKVELRPGPVKPPKATSESRSPSSSPVSSNSTSSDHSPAASHPSANPSHPSPVNPVHTVIKVAKEDYQEASKHGILAPPPPDASWAGKLYHQAKELFKFYWNGIKLINTHRKRVRDINARVKAGGPPLSRWETRFIANYKRDALKLIPFALIIIVAEEAIPLVVIYTPFLLPSTCLLPSQKERIDAKRREKQQTFAESMKPVFEGVHSRALEQPDASVDALLDGSALVSYNGVLSLSTFGPPLMRLRRIKKHLQAIAADDALLFRENAGERLSAEEVREALEERGIVTVGLSTDAMRDRLRWWLSHTSQPTDDPVRTRAVLVASNAIGKHELVPKA